MYTAHVWDWLEKQLRRRAKEQGFEVVKVPTLDRVSYSMPTPRRKLRPDHRSRNSSITAA